MQYIILMFLGGVFAMATRLHVISLKKKQIHLIWLVIMYLMISIFKTIFCLKNKFMLIYYLYPLTL